MAENATVRLSRFPWWFWVVMAGLFAILVVALGWFLQSPAFREMVRDRVVLELEKATGGEVEMQSLTWNVSKLEVEAKGITIRGLEPPTDIPLVHIDRLYARVHIVSFFDRNIDLQQLTLEQPVIHLIVKPDGSTNVPKPKVKSGGDPLQQLFDLAIGKAEVHNGALLLNEQKIPLDFKAYDVGMVMALSDAGCALRRDAAGRQDGCAVCRPARYSGQRQLPSSACGTTARKCGRSS